MGRPARFTSRDGAGEAEGVCAGRAREFLGKRFLVLVDVENIELEHQVLIDLVDVSVADSLHGTVVIEDGQIAVTLAVLEPADLRRIQDKDGIVLLDRKSRHSVLTGG